MYRKIKANEESISVNTSYTGETIEQKINRITNNKEPITDGAPLVYTDRKNGVGAEYNIRTDRFEIAIDAMDKVSGSMRAKREAKVVEMSEKVEKLPENKTGEESGA